MSVIKEYYDFDLKTMFDNCVTKQDKIELCKKVLTLHKEYRETVKCDVSKLKEELTKVEVEWRDTSKANNFLDYLDCFNDLAMEDANRELIEKLKKSKKELKQEDKKISSLEKKLKELERSYTRK